jgi:hypothetical protein
MKNYDVLKKQFLMNKIESYFNKNPKANSVLVNYSCNNQKTLWKVVKEENKFRITEINSTKSSFILEAGTQIMPRSQVSNNPPTNASAPTPMTPAKQMGGDPYYQGPEANQRGQQNFDAMQVAQKWSPMVATSQFAKTLHATKDLNQTLNLMYDDMLQLYQNDANMVNQIINNQYFKNAGVSINSKEQLIEPGMRAKISAYLKSVYPNLSRNYFKEAPSPTLGDPNKTGKGNAVLPNLGDDSLKFAFDDDLNQKAIATKMSQDADPEAKARGQKAIDWTRQYQQWVPHSPIGKFAQTLAKTRDLSQTLNLMYDDMMKIYGNNQNMVNQTISHYFSDSGISINSKQNLLMPDTRAKIAAHVKSLFPNLAKNYFAESKKKLNEDPLQQVNGGSSTPVDVPSENPEKSSKDTIEKQKSEEEMMVGKNLSGQTIKHAKLDLDPVGGSLTLELVNTNVPAKLEWNNEGKIIFIFNDRPYTIRRGK